jgi:hypothetical protein
MNSTLDYTLWTLYSSYFKGIGCNFELLVCSVTCLPKHGGARDNKFLVSRPMTDQRCLAIAIACQAISYVNSVNHCSL